MFNSNLVCRRAVGRLAFGFVLLAGACVLVTELGGSGRLGAPALTILVTTWAAAFAGYGLARRLVARGAAAPVSERLFAASYVVPSVGLALALPLTIHAPFFVLLDGSWIGFDAWAELSVEFMGVTHIVFAALAAVRAHRLAHGHDAMRPSTIFWLCVGVSCVPFVVYLAIPPILVALTGIPLVVLMRWSEWSIARERADLLASELPMAVARRIPDAA